MKTVSSHDSVCILLTKKDRLTAMTWRDATLASWIKTWMIQSTTAVSFSDWDAKQMPIGHYLWGGNKLTASESDGTRSLIVWLEYCFINVCYFLQQLKFGNCDRLVGNKLVAFQAAALRTVVHSTSFSVSRLFLFIERVCSTVHLLMTWDGFCQKSLVKVT